MESCMNEEITYYELLRVSFNATPEEIRKAYRKRASECHPDKVRDLDPDIQALAERKMAQINEAYQVLMDEERRREYDNFLLNELKLKVDEEGNIVRETEEKAAEEPADTEELIRRIEETISDVKRQIMTIDPEIRWKEGRLEGFDVVLEGAKKIERYFIYINTTDILTAEAVRFLAENAEAITSRNKFLLHKKHSLFLTFYLRTEQDEEIRTAIRDFNFMQMNKTGARRSEIIMLAIGNINTKEIYFPYVKAFKPDLSRMVLK